MFEKSNSTIAYVLYVKEMEISLAYISKINLNCEEQFELIWKKGWYYLQKIKGKYLHYWKE